MRLHLVLVLLAKMALTAGQGPPGGGTGGCSGSTCVTGGGGAGGGSYNQPMLGKHPLIIDILPYMNLTLPCTVPCLLDNAYFILREVADLEDSQSAMCVNAFITSVERDFTDRIQMGPFDTYSAQWLKAFGNRDSICEKLQYTADCLLRASGDLCGSAGREGAQMLFNSVLSMADCKVDDFDRKYLFQCLVPPLEDPYSPSFQAGLLQFTKCVETSVAFFNQPYEEIYRMLASGDIYQFNNTITSVVQCYIRWLHPYGPNPSYCYRAVDYIMEQISTTMMWLARGAGGSMFSCLGDLSMYLNDYSYGGRTMEQCIMHFINDGAGIIQRLEQIFSDPTRWTYDDARRLLKDVAEENCRTGSIGRLTDCMVSVMKESPHRRCGEHVIPTVMHMIAPGMDYLQKLGKCSGPQYGPYSPVCVCQAGLVDHIFRTEVSTQCKRPVKYTITFALIKDDYYDALQLQAAIQPQVDDVFRRIYGQHFIASENYRFWPSKGCMEVMVDLLFEDTVMVHPDALVMEFMRGLNGGYIYDPRGLPCKVQDKCPPPVPEGLSATLIIIIIVAAVGGFLLLLLLLFCCCCHESCCPQKSHHSKVSQVTAISNGPYVQPNIYASANLPYTCQPPAPEVTKIHLVLK